MNYMSVKMATFEEDDETWDEEEGDWGDTTLSDDYSVIQRFIPTPEPIISRLRSFDRLFPEEPSDDIQVAECRLMAFC